MAGDEPAERPKRNIHGRRSGYRLRQRQRDLLAQHLPLLTIDLPTADSQNIDLSSLFGARSNDVWLEIGYGAGEHLAAQAAAHSERGFIGCEPYLNGVARFVVEAQQRDLTNVRLFQDDARLLVAALPAASIGRIFLLFPDPWPKRRHHKRRIIAGGMLMQLARILKEGGELRFATDHPELCRWSLFHILNNGAFDWLAESASDWRRRPDDWPATRYENKALSTGRSPAYLRFRRRRSGALQPGHQKYLS